MSTHYVLKIQYVNKPPETRNIGARVTTIGREAGDIVLGDPQSSGRHAEIYFENGNVRVKDLGSTNGTFFNGQRAPEFALQAGQGFSIGQTVMTLMAVHDAQQRPGAGKTMIAMGGMPPRPPGPPGAPPGAPPRPPGAPPAAGFGPPPGAPPQGAFGGPPPSSPPQGGFGAPPPSSPPPGAPGGFGAPPPGGGFGAAPPSSPPPGAPPQGAFGAPPPGPPPGAPPPGGAFGAPPPGGPPPGGAFGAPPPGAPPQGGGAFGAPPPGGPPPGGGAFGAPPQDQPGQMAPAGGAFAAAGAAMNPPQQFGGPGAMAPSAGGEIRGDFSGSGGELLGQLFVGYLLTLITFGIYGPWFMCKFANFIAERVTFGPTASGTVRFRFEGQGGELFVTFLVGYLLTMVTFGIYAPWFMCKLTKFFADNTLATSDDGSNYKPSFGGTGGDLFVTFLVGYLLTLVTFGIYFPWFLCKINKWYASNTKITKNGQVVGDMDFTGEGGELLVTFIVGYLLTMITFGIYGAWFQCKLLAFNADNTKINVEGRRFGMRFTGEGGELFVIVLVGYLLSIVTLGIYMFWMMAKLLKWQLSNTVVFPDGGAPMAMGAPMGGGQIQQFGGPPQGQMYGQPPQGQLGAPGGYGQPPQQGYGGPPQGGFGGPPQGGGYA